MTSMSISLKVLCQNKWEPWPPTQYVPPLRHLSTFEPAWWALAAGPGACAQAQCTRRCGCPLPTCQQGPAPLSGSAFQSQLQSHLNAPGSGQADAHIPAGGARNGSKTQAGRTHGLPMGAQRSDNAVLRGPLGDSLSVPPGPATHTMHQLGGSSKHRLESFPEGRWMSPQGPQGTISLCVHLLEGFKLTIFFTGSRAFTFGGWGMTLGVCLSPGHQAQGQALSTPPHMCQVGGTAMALETPNPGPPSPFSDMLRPRGAEKSTSLTKGGGAHSAFLARSSGPPSLLV